ncbi:hypothetical protein PVAND_002593 [Polypedilum vanderplanki]|uniref:Uncharacterized protein n=1 Tax=Polypedilum vanderplanki TaxID=319348 RepID=A0A9J6BRV1_POLVA|nr:hypothetical protein PVAND_002593 [Polypedilum vanderplanki]
MASSENNENNSLISSYNDKSISRSHLIEHEEINKSDQMASSKKLSDSNDEEIANLNDSDLKNLLDEAMNYKNPHDIVNKSETFKRLLQNVTEEDEQRKRKFESDSLRWKAQSNSLQNLLDDSHYHLPSHPQISSKKHQQRRKNSTSVSTRRLEGGSLPVDMHHSSVVQSTSDQPFLSELKNNKKRKEKQQQQQLQQQQQAKDTVIDMDMETDDRNKNFVKCLDSSSKDTSSHSDAPMIEMKYLQNRSSINDIDIERESVSSKFTIANNTPNTITSMASIGSPIPSIHSSKSSSNAITSSVDSVIHLPTFIEKPKAYQQAQIANTIYAPASTINHSNNIVLTGGDSNLGASSSSGNYKLLNEQHLQLPSGPAINSVLDPKYAKYKTGGGQNRDDVSSMNQTSTSSSSILPASHSSSNNTASKESKNNKKRTAKSERNVKNVDVKSIEGYRGDDDVEKLLDYIEGQNQENKNQKNHPKNGIVSNTNEQKLLSAEEKKKKLAKNKEKVNKLKKSNSMDELCSTNRQKETQAAEAEAAAESAATANKTIYDVTLRSKSSNLTSGAKKEKSSSEKIQSKRNERRSWGTEGLWPDTLSASTSSCLQTTKDNHQDEQLLQQHEINETSSSSSSSGVQLDFTDTVNLTNFESINALNETDKFQVVSKKRKVKRKSNEAPEVTSSKHNNFHMPALRRDGNNLRSGTKYTSNESSRNDSNIKSNNSKNSKPMSQDAKQMNANKNRRKSTSSMPSDGEYGEYSDGGDSVQSLPIENTKSLLSTSISTAPNTSAENSGKSKKLSSSNPIQISPSLPQQPPQQQKPTTFSYADIAKTNTNRNNNNVIAASTEKWPSISSSSSSHQNNNSNAIDPFAISNFDAINNNNNNSNSSSQNVNNAATVVSINNNQKQQQLHYKSTPTTIINTSMMSSFPNLVESNNNRNKQLSNSPLEIQQTASSNGDAPQTDNKLSFNNGNFERGMLVTAGGSFDNNNNSNTITSNSSNTDDRNNNNSQKISYSQSLLENYTEIDSNGNNSKLEANLTNTVTISQSSKNILTKSKSVDHNNLSSIEHYPALEKTKQTLSDVLSKPIETLSNKTKIKQQHQQLTTNAVKEDNINNSPLVSINNVNINSINPTSAVIMSSGITTNATINKRAKKDKLALKKSTSTVSTSTAIMNMQQQHNQFSTQNAVNHHQHRPAVIILNDDNEKSNDFELGITFGFDINEHLLFGHQNGDADHPSVEMNINNNNSNCDIMNTNLSSNNININNLTNQSCGFEMYENFVSPQSGIVIIDHSQQLIHQPAIMQSSSTQINTSTIIVSTCTNQNKDCVNTATAATNTILDSSNDLGYLSSSMQTNSTTPPANNQKVANEILPLQIQQMQQQQSDNNQIDKQQTQNIKDIKQHTKLEELKMLTLPRFITPEPSVKNFNYDELVTFVSEEWTKVMNNGVIFNGLQMI